LIDRRPHARVLVAVPGPPDVRVLDVIPCARTVGARLLRSLGHELGAYTIAERLEVPVEWICSWLHGNRPPEPRLRAALESEYKIPVAAWEQRDLSRSERRRRRRALEVAA
jgi:hypothetical protein